MLAGSEPQATIKDPLLGSGTVAEVCTKFGRKCVQDWSCSILKFSNRSPNRFASSSPASCCAFAESASLMNIWRVTAYLFSSTCYFKNDVVQQVVDADIARDNCHNNIVRYVRGKQYNPVDNEATAAGELICRPRVRPDPYRWQSREESKMNLGATLYLHNSVEAVDFYRDVFGLTLGYHVRYEDGTFLHAELMKQGASIFAVSESADLGIAAAMLRSDRPTMSYGVDLDTDDELRHAYRLLSEGGKVLRPLGALPWSPCSADVIDRFGVYWYIYVQQAKPDDAAMAEWLQEGNTF